MDELWMVRRLLVEPPASQDVVAKGRQRLLRSRASARPVRRARFRGAVVLAVTAASTGLVILTPLLVASTPQGRGDPHATYASARNVLLAAATRAESAPEGGTYWHLRSLSRTTLPQRFGRSDSPYVLERVLVREEWTRRNGQAWSGTREWVQPKTPGDVAAWRRDGARSEWCNGRTDTQPARPICLRTAPGTASLTRNFFPFEVAEGHELTFVQLQQLPENPRALRVWLMRITRRDLDPSAPIGIVDSNVVQILANLLVYPPVPPGVRAAAYRALAAMPGVTSIGSTRDELGRTGIGIRITGGQGMAFVPGAAGPVKARSLTRTLIIDPRTSHILADETSVGSNPVTDTVILAVGWTNVKPHEPALP